ncbi:MAG: LysR family transcriptional regulator, partial [Pseudomonadota bacterium]
GIAPKACVERSRGGLVVESLPLPEPWAARQLLLCSRSFEDLPPYAASLLEAICAVA